MPDAKAKLSRLRNWFVVYFVVQTVLADIATIRALESLPPTIARGAGSTGGWGAASIVPAVLVQVVILALLLWVFHALLRLRSWARALLLVGGWLGLLTALWSLVSMAGLPAVQCWLPGAGWKGLALLGLVSNAINLLFAGYLLAVLQFDREVKAAFAGPPAAAPPAP